jgi:hypothetical protein
MAALRALHPDRESGGTMPKSCPQGNAPTGLILQEIRCRLGAAGACHGDSRRDSSPLFFKGPGRPAFLSLPPALSLRISGKPDMRAEGMERREAPNMCTLQCTAPPCDRRRPAPRGAPSRCRYGARAALLAADPFPTGEWVALTVSKLLAAGLIAGGIAVCNCANCVNLFARAPSPPEPGGCVTSSGRGHRILFPLKRRLMTAPPAGTGRDKAILS